MNDMNNMEYSNGTSSDMNGFSMHPDEENSTFGRFDVTQRHSVDRVNTVTVAAQVVLPQVVDSSRCCQLNALQSFDSVMRHTSFGGITVKTDLIDNIDYYKDQVRLGLSVNGGGAAGDGDGDGDALLDKKNSFNPNQCHLMDVKPSHKYLNKQNELFKLLPMSTATSTIVHTSNIHDGSLIMCKPRYMIDVGTMTDPLTPEEQERLCQWEGFAALQSGNKVAEYLTSLREFLKITPPNEGRKRQGLGDVKIVTAPDGSRFFCCSECHMAYSDKCALEQHLTNHKVERRFICVICGAGLKRKEHLDRHQLSHSDERPYTCDSCPKTFKRNEHLARHYIVHTGEKGQVCPECGKAFYRRDHLQKHTQGHIAKKLRLAIQSTGPATACQTAAILHPISHMHVNHSGHVTVIAAANAAAAAAAAAIASVPVTATATASAVAAASSTIATTSTVHHALSSTLTAALPSAAAVIAINDNSLV